MIVVEAMLHFLLVQTVALSLCVVGVRILQALVARRFGAGAGYLCWLLAPVAMLAVALPHAAHDALVVRVDVTAVAPAWAAATRAPRQSTGTAALLVGATWLAGATLLAILLVRRQSRFEAMVLRADDAPPQLPAGSGPAVLGVLRPCIALPRDFHSAFDGEERRLMLLHEQVHLRRRDNLWNLLANALLVVHWFNPIAWWAARRLRIDQETACDAAVLRHEPLPSLARYAGALLKVQGVVPVPPLAVAWQSTHPLVERVRMLQDHRLSFARHRAGLRLAALSIVLAGVGGYALQADAGAASGATGGPVLTAVELQVDDAAPMASRLLTQPGQQAVMRFEPDASRPGLLAPVELAYTVTRLDGDRLQIDTALRQGEPLAAIGSPRLVVRDGQAATVRVTTSDGAHVVQASFVPRVLVVAPPALPQPPAVTAPAPPPVPSTDGLPAVPPVPPQRAL